MTRLAPILALVVAFSVLATGCSVRRGAPVVERAPGSKSATTTPRVSGAATPRAGDLRAEFYTVRKGDTLFSIALDNGLDYRELAEWNGITDPGVIRVGQEVRIRPPKSAATIAPLKTSPAVEGRPIAGAQQSKPGAPGRMKTEPQAVRVPYTDQAYTQLAHAKAKTV
ncbi:MAG: LysM peptidoglycan-binding domain-containing protein, partial [Gammaproteobacteria bacterium]|nr:LysM peptidoglycan-binding domain-containing protein [Gammaproteobacteria bacterium]